MYRTMIKRMGIVVLALAQLGCNSQYRFRCTSNPKGAVALVGGEAQGETDCTVEIPKDSDLIRDGRIEFTFRLPDGREQTKTMDLHELKTANDFALIVAAPFLAAGFVLLVPWVEEDDEDEEDDEFANEAGLLGLGSLGIGMGIFFLLGGDTEAGLGYSVHVDFPAPADVNAPVNDSNQPAPAVPAEMSP